MMQLLRLLGISLLAGCIGAGLVWYGWGLAENAASVLRTRRALAAARTPDKEEREDLDADDAEPKAATS